MATLLLPVHTPASCHSQYATYTFWHETRALLIATKPHKVKRERMRDDAKKFPGKDTGKRGGIRRSMNLRSPPFYTPQNLRAPPRQPFSLSTPSYPKNCHDGIKQAHQERLVPMLSVNLQHKLDKVHVDTRSPENGRRGGSSSHPCAWRELRHIP